MSAPDRLRYGVNIFSFVLLVGNIVSLLQSFEKVQLGNQFLRHLEGRNILSNGSKWIRKTEISRLITTFTGSIKSKRFNEVTGKTTDLYFISSASARMPYTTINLATSLTIFLIKRDYGTWTLNLPKVKSTSSMFMPELVMSLQK